MYCHISTTNTSTNDDDIGSYLHAMTSEGAMAMSANTASLFSCDDERRSKGNVRKY